MTNPLSALVGAIPNLAHSRAQSDLFLKFQDGSEVGIDFHGHRQLENDSSESGRLPFTAILVVFIHFLGAMVLRRSRTKLGGRDAPITANERKMVEMLGYSSLGTGLTSLLTLWWGNNPRVPASVGFLPRAVHLALYCVRPNDSEVKLAMLVPVYAMLGFCVANMFLAERFPFEADDITLVMWMGYIHLFLGTVFCTIPAVCARYMNYDKFSQAMDAGAAKAACDDHSKLRSCYMHALIRSQGKKEMIFGGLLLGLGMERGVWSIGFSCGIWAISILVTDVVFQNYRDMGSSKISPLIQLSVALLGLKNLSVW